MNWTDLRGMTEGTPASQEDLGAFQEKEGFSHPDELAAHWLKYGGLVPSPPLTMGDQTIYGLYSFRRAVDRRAGNKGQIPAGYIPVGHDVASEPILVALDDGNHGAVYESCGVAHLDVDLKFTKIADDFDEFLAMLFQDPNVALSPLEKLVLKGRLPALRKFFSEGGGCKCFR